MFWMPWYVNSFSSSLLLLFFLQFIFLFEEPLVTEKACKAKGKDKVILFYFHTGFGHPNWQEASHSLTDI